MSIYSGVSNTSLFSKPYHEFKGSCKNFGSLTLCRKVAIVALTALATVATIFLLGIGGVLVFNALVKHSKEREEVGTPVISSHSSATTHTVPDTTSRPLPEITSVSESDTRSSTVTLPSSSIPSVIADENENVQFERGLERWINDETVTGYKIEAAKRIKDVFYHHGTELSLRGHRLSGLPPEIGNLVALTYLDLAANRLESLPPEIGNLVALTHLHLGDNCLKSLPSEIGNLEVLTYLSLNHNRLESLPSEIGNLEALTRLRLGGNCLKSLPSEIGNLAALTCLELSENELKTLPREIGNLVALTELNLSSNRLESLPPEIGNLEALYALNLSSNRLESLPSEIGTLVRLVVFCFRNNPQLQTLPMTMGNLSRLTHFSIENTAIPEGVRIAILAACRAQRNRSAPHELPRHLSLWKGYAEGHAGRSFSLDFIESELTENQKYSIHEWLIRLERAPEFSRAQGPLAEKVCAILETLNTNSDFKVSFFNQIDVNLENCQDRAAMSFNEIYTYWLLCTMESNSDLKAKLIILAGLAKTFALRKELAKRIAEKGAVQESVEIYLFYESRLKDRLGLMTAIDHMSYAQIGERDWLSENSLVAAVNEHYMDELIDFPLVQKMMEEENAIDDSSIAASSSDTGTKGLHERMEELDDQLLKEEINEQEYNACAMALRTQFEDSERQFKGSQKAQQIAWLRKQLD